jgi:hypothetical protein
MADLGRELTNGQPAIAEWMQAGYTPGAAREFLECRASPTSSLCSRAWQ